MEANIDYQQMQFILGAAKARLEDSTRRRQEDQVEKLMKKQIQQNAERFPIASLVRKCGSVENIFDLIERTGPPPQSSIVRDHNRDEQIHASFETLLYYLDEKESEFRQQNSSSKNMYAEIEYNKRQVEAIARFRESEGAELIPPIMNKTNNESSTNSDYLKTTTEIKRRLANGMFLTENIATIIRDYLQLRLQKTKESSSSS